MNAEQIPHAIQMLRAITQKGLSSAHVILDIVEMDLPAPVRLMIRVCKPVRSTR